MGIIFIYAELCQHTFGPLAALLPSFPSFSSASHSAIRSKISSSCTKNKFSLKPKVTVGTFYPPKQKHIYIFCITILVLTLNWLLYTFCISFCIAGARPDITIPNMEDIMLTYFCCFSLSSEGNILRNLPAFRFSKSSLAVAFRTLASCSLCNVDTSI